MQVRSASILLRLTFCVSLRSACRRARDPAGQLSSLPPTMFSSANQLKGRASRYGTAHEEPTPTHIATRYDSNMYLVTTHTADTTSESAPSNACVLDLKSRPPGNFQATQAVRAMMLARKTRHPARASPLPSPQKSSTPQNPVRRPFLPLSPLFSPKVVNRSATAQAELSGGIRDGCVHVALRSGGLRNQ